MLILKNPSCKVHISECHQPHWVTPCQLDLPVEFKNSHLICLFIRHASILPNTQKFLQESSFSGYYRGYAGVQKTMTVECCLKKENNKAFSIEAIISNCLPKRFAENNRQVTEFYPFPNCQNYPKTRAWLGASFFPSPNRIHSNLYQTNNEC